MLELIDEGADISARDVYQGATPFHYLAGNLSVNCLSLLLSHTNESSSKEALNVMDNFGQTALFRPMRYHKFDLIRNYMKTSIDALATMSLLLAHGAQVNMADDFGESPLDLAVKKRFVEGVELLFKYGANSGKLGNPKGLLLDLLQTVDERVDMYGFKFMEDI